MADFTHNGISISLTAHGKFAAVIDGKNTTAPSLDAIKKKIDGPSSAAFQEFPALLVSEYRGAPDPVKVVGIKKSRRTSWRSDEWLLDSGATQRAVAKDTKENRASIQAYYAARLTLRNEKDRLELLVREARSAIEFINPPEKK